MIKPKKVKPLTSKQKWYQYCKRHPLLPCEICGATEHINRHHLADRRFYPCLVDVETNIINLCPSCHKWGKKSAHRNAIYFSEWLRANKPEQFAWVMEHIQ